jgi:hypothetical protein
LAPTLTLLHPRKTHDGITTPFPFHPRRGQASRETWRSKGVAATIAVVTLWLRGRARFGVSGTVTCRAVPLLIGASVSLAG